MNLCSTCHARPRRPKQLNCLWCHAEAQRKRRAKTIRIDRDHYNKLKKIALREDISALLTLARSLRSLDSPEE